MATEDTRYRQSSQYRLWSFSPSHLSSLRTRTNTLATTQITPRLPPHTPFLTAPEETVLIRYLTTELLRAASFIELPTTIRCTAAIFFRRFYITNSIMTYPPGEILKTCLFFGCKAEGYFIKLDKLVEKMSGTTSEKILAGEFLLCQGNRFAFDVRHPFLALEGAIFEMRRRGEFDEHRINKAHIRAREFLKFSTLITDVYFHFTPSQIMMAALQIVDEELFRTLAPGDEKMLAVISACRAMLEEEPPERMASYWDTPEAAKAIKPLRKKLAKCRDPDRFDLVALQRARRENANSTTNTKLSDAKPANNTKASDADVFETGDRGDAKRRKVQDNIFGPPL